MVAVLTLAVGLPGVLAAAESPPAAEAGTAGGVPGQVFDPWPWQPPVTQSPAGPAAMLLSGSGTGLGTLDLFVNYGSKIAVVGRDGSYRMLRYPDYYLQAGQDVRLSPDGRYVAGPYAVEKLAGAVQAEGRLSVVDLVTGRARVIDGLPARLPVAWRPDSAALLLWQRPEFVSPGSPPFDGGEASYGYAGGSLWLLDLATGGSRKILDLGTAVFDPTTSVAFAPDGRHLAVQLDRTVVLVDTAGGGSRTLATLGERQRLAGAGAFTADGTALAVLDLDGCAVACTNGARNQRRWGLVTLGVTSGRVRPDGGFDRVPGAAVRMVGWQRDGTAVVVAYRVEDDARYDREPAREAPVAYREVEAADLLALRPGGGTTVLVRPRGVAMWDIDVASDLVVDGRFQAAAYRPAVFPAAYWAAVPAAGVVLSPLGLLAVLLVRRRRGRAEFAAERDG